MINEILNNKIEIIYTKKSSDTHYKLTNYNYKKPELGKKIISDQYIDLGAGLLECMDEISKQVGEKALL